MVLLFVFAVGGRGKRSENERASGRRRNSGGKVSGEDKFTSVFSDQLFAIQINL